MKGVEGWISSLFDNSSFDPIIPKRGSLLTRSGTLLSFFFPFIFFIANDRLIRIVVGEKTDVLFINGLSKPNSEHGIKSRNFPKEGFFWVSSVRKLMRRKGWGGGC